MPVMILPVLILSAAAAQPVVETHPYCVKGKCQQVEVTNRPVYGGLYGFRERPGGRVFTVYAGPLGTIPRRELQAANGYQEKPAPQFLLVSTTPKK